VSTALILPPAQAIPGIGILVGAGSSLAKGAATAIFDGLSGWLIAGAAALVDHTVTLMSSTSPDLGTAWYVARMRVMVLILGMVVWPLLAAATIGAILRQDLRRLGRTWGVALPVALIVGGGALPLTGEALRVSDALTSVLWHDEGGAVHDALTRLASAMATTIGTGNSFVAAVIALVVIAGATLLWVELLLRSAAIYVAVAFLPLALAGLVWPATLHWSKRLVEVLVALILSKFVIVAAITLAIGAVGTAKTADQVLEGGAILLMAAFTPFLLLRLAPVMEAAAIGHLEGASLRPFHATQRLASQATALGDHPLVGLLSEPRRGNDRPDPTGIIPQPLAPTGGDLEREHAALEASTAAASGDHPDGVSAPLTPGSDGGTVTDER
jgi:hypothetical protein